MASHFLVLLDRSKDERPVEVCLELQGVKQWFDQSFIRIRGRCLGKFERGGGKPINTPGGCELVIGLFIGI